ncbi:MAG: hypothetical protein HOW73_25255 [Polyangiaceae bacterium]|nr:hypothetical protein [Polyangiaceae bacterium]
MASRTEKAPALDVSGRREEMLRLTLRFVAVVLAYSMAVSAHYGLAPGPFYFLLLLGDPPVLAGVAFAVFLARGPVRLWLAVALVAYLVLATVAFGDLAASRMHIAALKPLGSKAGWSIAACANMVSLYATLFAARFLPQRPLQHTLGRISIGLFVAASIGFVVARWIRLTPPLVPFFNACLFIIPAGYLFEVTGRPRH